MSGIRKLIVHIGTEKTGTTSLQHFLRHNANGLERAGIWYPSEPSSSYCQSAAHFPLAGSLAEYCQDFVPPSKSNNLSVALRDFCADAFRKDFEIAVISAEHFSSRVRDGNKVKLFRETLSRVFQEIRIACYIRKQPDMATSGYFTGVVNGRREPLDPSLISESDPYFNHLLMLDLWAGAFGRESMIVRDYGGEDKASIDVCEDFCVNTLNVDVRQLLPVEKRNTSQGAVFIEMIRQLNMALYDMERDASSRRAAQGIRSFVLKNLSIRNDARLSLSPEEEERVISRFADINRKIRDRYLNGRMSEAWFRPCSRSSNELMIDEKALADRSLRAMTELVVALLRSQQAR